MKDNIFEKENGEIYMLQKSKVDSLLKNTCSRITEHGIDSIKEMFSAGSTLQATLKVSKENEYIKRMLISQMDIDRMLIVHKYYAKGFEAKSEFIKESDSIKSKVQSDSTLVFDDNTIKSLFGNSLDIISEEELDKWKQLVYGGSYLGKDVTTIYEEEKFKVNYENEKNGIKKFIQLFKYRTLFKQDGIEDSHMQKVRRVLRDCIINNQSESTAFVLGHSTELFQNGISEYENLQELESIAKITLISMQQQEGEKINIEEFCNKIRSMMQYNNSSKFSTEYRNKQVTLGREHGINNGTIIQTIPFEEVPTAIQDLQNRYNEIYDSSQSEEEYVREITKIYADYIYIQPYEDGNKRTAACLFNSMLLSKGILPPPVSLINDEQMAIAFDKAKDKDYTMLQDIVIDEYNKTKQVKVNNESIKSEISITEDYIEETKR